MNVPSILQCCELFTRYRVPGTIRVHCETVHKVAVFLTQQLKEQGYPLDLTIVSSFSLLHDFMKAVVLERLTDPPYNYHPTNDEVKMHQRLRQQFAGMSETKVASLLLQDNYPEFAKLFLELDELTQNPHALVHEETKFIHYVDWRVLGNKVVPLSERMAYIYQRYGPWIEKKQIDWEATKQEQQEYERKIFNQLPFEPQELAQNVKL